MAYTASRITAYLILTLAFTMLAGQPVGGAKPPAEMSMPDWRVTSLTLPDSAVIAMGSPISFKQTGASALGWGKDGEPLLYVSSPGVGGSDHLYRFRLGETQPSGDYPFLGGGGQLWSMVALENGDVYFTCNATLFKYSAVQDRVITLGRPHTQTGMIWQLAVAPDGIIYGATYPKARIFQLDPSNDRFTDLGSVANTEYARSIAVSERYVFVGTGPDPDIVAYDRKTGETRSLLPESLKQPNSFVSKMDVRGNRLFAPSGKNTSTALVFDVDTLAQVGRVFEFSYPISPLDHNGQAWFRSGASPYLYDLKTDRYRQGGWTIPASHSMDWAHVPANAIPEARRQFFSGVSLIGFSGDSYWAMNPESKQVLIIPVDIPPSPSRINSLGAREGKVYGGAFSPGGLFIYDTTTKETITTPALGQTDSLTLLNGMLYFGTYTGAQLKVYNVAEAKAEIVGPVGYNQDRTVAMIEHQGSIYVGTVPDYGFHGGALAIINPANNQVKTYFNVVPNHSVVSLAGNGTVVFGGTSTQGGLGRDKVPGNAYLFAWDTASQSMAWSLQPIAEPAIGALVMGADGLLWGAGTHSIFAFDPGTKEVVFKHQVINANAPSYSMREAFASSYKHYVVITLNSSYMMIIDTLAHSIKVLPGSFNRNTIDDDGVIYFTRGTELFSIAPEVWMQL